MEIEQRIGEAKYVIHDLLQTFGKRHTRIHKDAAGGNTQRLRALEGLCGQCQFVEVDIRRINGKMGVGIGCDKGLSPIKLYENTPLGEEASCEPFRKRGVVK
jgi:hypothetical protein